MKSVFFHYDNFKASLIAELTCSFPSIDAPAKCDCGDVKWIFYNKKGIMNVFHSRVSDGCIQNWIANHRKYKEGHRTFVIKVTYVVWNTVATVHLTGADGHRQTKLTSLKHFPLFLCTLCSSWDGYFSRLHNTHYVIHFCCKGWLEWPRLFGTINSCSYMVGTYIVQKKALSDIDNKTDCTLSILVVNYRAISWGRR